MLWLNFLHFYQPANAEFYTIRKALDKSYWRLIRLMEENSELRMTWNISGCLLERLADEKETAFLERLKFLVKNGRIEITGTAAYHGFLPLLPEIEVGRQIKINEKILRKHFGKNFKPNGFFLPEMAYAPNVAKIVKHLGYSWIILDEISFSGDLHRHPEISERYIDAASGLTVLFRNREISNSYPPEKLFSLLKEEKYYLTATDAELYGLRHEDPTAEIEKIVKAKNLKTMTISNFLKTRQKKKALNIEVVSSSWESTPSELKKNHPYYLWQSKDNKIQTDLWKLAQLAWRLDHKYKNDKNYYWYRWHLVRGLASCTFWWASARDFSKIYGPYAWSPDDIERGLEDLVRSVRSFNNLKTKKVKIEAEKYYLRIKKNIWSEHWKKHWQKNI